ncbi:MAG TPA: two-component regulator propeller domain-containing protein, partial [Rhodothermia bacterium]
MPGARFHDSTGTVATSRTCNRSYKWPRFWRSRTDLGIRKPGTWNLEPGTPIELGTWNLELGTCAIALLIFHFSFSISLAQIDRQEIPSPLSARAVSPRFEHLELEDGLSQGSIHDLHQDTHGFLWIATQDGLNRYDGHEIKVYNHEPFDDETLTDSWISDIEEDADGALWLPTLRGGLNRMDPVTEKFTSYRHDPDDSTSVLPGQMNDVLVDSDGRIWVAGGRGLSRMDAERKGIFERFEYDPDDPTSLCHIQAFSVFEDSSGLIWVGT